ncbi:DUF6169 family protein [Flavobacterium sp. MC2016-06]|uniref:DUF6169 family protein n=1 Tax=Flavobacterium sp. MC2016-06 TaxID=2676308 RepID=UPI0012BAA84D|nr:DUF6169 family protein [Flavobacterium sp. MC2016-06]MBU3860503.1 hypothetical protein [Flavobacterium sp. MC2016-06]
MPNPYNYFFDETTQSYHFKTKNDIDYRVAFIIDHTFSAVSGIEMNNIYQIIIEKVDDRLEKFDSQVSATVQLIVLSFFGNAQNAMIYICDDTDHKGKKRFDAFERWYRTSTFNNDIKKVNNVIVCNTDNQDWTLYTSLLYHQKNINKKTIIEVYHTLQEILNEK